VSLPERSLGRAVRLCTTGPRHRSPPGRIPAPGTLVAVPEVVVDVVLKPEISDPQGQAVLGALGRLGHSGIRSVRQGKHFVLEVDGEPDEAELRKIAETLLANPVIEDVELHLPTD
jgi:phosphoribosylformylglycinamidine synthase PurS subunit